MLHVHNELQRLSAQYEETKRRLLVQFLTVIKMDPDDPSIEAALSKLKQMQQDARSLETSFEIARHYLQRPSLH